MAVKDYTKHFDGLREGGSAVPTPNTVSRAVEVGDRSFQTIVWQSGKAVLDSELQLGQDAAWWDNALFRKWQVPSGWLRGTTHHDSLADYTLVTAPVGVVDDSGNSHILPDLTLINAFLLPRVEAVVAGRPLVVEYTNTQTSGWNLVALSDPQIYDGTPGTVKRTDFVFLEVWLALVAPSPRAQGTVQVADATALVPGDLITIDGLNLTAAAAPAVNCFVPVAGDNVATATAIAQAINDPVNAFALLVTAYEFGDTVLIESLEAGAVGNLITLTVTTAVVGALVASGPLLTGGEDRYSKPAQDKLYRHGNVDSPTAVWLDDELVDPVVHVETSQRVQLQYRIRTTDQSQGVNYKKHPDGFSSTAGGPPAPIIYAQGGTAAPVATYPFVPADVSTAWLNSSATAYGVDDSGLWVAGDGSKASAKALGSVDGFVYAIPICFVYRHNDSSSANPGFQGFDPVANANAGPLYEHLGYNGPLGAIPAGASDRPDGHYADVLDSSRIHDLRRHVTIPGLDTSRELQYQIQSLLDGTNLTWAVDTASIQDLGGSSGDVSTQHLVCNEVGRSTVHNGNNVTSGNTPRGVSIRDFDHVARRFGDQSVVERVVIAFYPGDRDVGPVVAPGRVNAGKYVTKAAGPADEWTEGDVLHLDLTLFNATTLGGVFQGTEDGGPSFVPGFTPSVAEFAPPGTVITDVLSIRHDDGFYAGLVSQDVQVQNVLGLGTMHLEVLLDGNTTQVSNGMPVDGLNPVHQMVVTGGLGTGSARRIFLEVEITYPIGVGLTDTPNLHLLPDATVFNGAKSSGEAPGPGPVIENDANQRPNDFESLLPPVFRDTYREVMLEYVANDTVDHNPGLKMAGSPVGSVNTETLVSGGTTWLRTPRRVFGSGSNLPTVTDLVTAGAKVIDNALTEYGSSSRRMDVTVPLSGAGHTLCEVTYFPQDPIPNYGVLGGGYQVSVYFRSTAPQTAGVKEGDILSTGDGVLPTTLNVEPLLMGPTTWTGQVGSGSQDRAYPYGQPLEHIPVNDLLAGLTREWYFCATANISVSDFNAGTGLLSLHPFVQPDAQNVLQFGGAANDRKPRKDAEFRAFYPFAADWVYRPTVLTQPLSGAVRHKVLFPFLARIVEDVHAVDGNGILFRKNEVALVVLTRFAALDDDNGVRFTDTDNTTCAAVYRTRNMLLVVGDRFRPVPPAPLP